MRRTVSRLRAVVMDFREDAAVSLDMTESELELK